MLVNNRFPLIIAGMHRSGTSMIARFLHESGINLGDNLLPPNSSNIYGHYEDIDILEFHRKILRREFGHQMWVPRVLRPNELHEDDRQEAREIACRRIKNQFWGWKEPRTSLFLDLWGNICPNASYLFIVRDPISVVDSLLRRENRSSADFGAIKKFLQNWTLYNSCIFSFYKKRKSDCIMVPLDRAVLKSEDFLGILSDHISYRLDNNLFRRMYDSNVLRTKSIQFSEFNISLKQRVKIMPEYVAASYLHSLMRFACNI
jgi:hypothetical protein